jgi:hypothetical protein
LGTSAELKSAFTAAIEQTHKCLAAGMIAIDGQPARSQLERLANALELERDRSDNRGTVDREWIQTTVRWLVEWIPDTDLTLIAAIGRIARTTPTDKP